MKENPITILVDKGEFRQPSFTLNTQDLMVTLERILVREPIARHLPAIIQALEDKDSSVIKKLVENQYGGLNSSYNLGMSNSVLCNASYTTEAYARWEAEAMKGAEPFRELNYWLLPCENWGYNPDETRKPFKSDIPSLILTGEFDVTTTERETRTHIPYFKNLQYYIIPGMSHGPPSSREAPCWENLIQQFIANPYKKVNADCLKKIKPATASLELPEWLKEK